MEEREQKEILARLKASKDNNVMLRNKDGKKYSFTILDLIKLKERMYAVVKPPIDFPSAKPNSIKIFVVLEDEEESLTIRPFNNDKIKLNVFNVYNERRCQSA